MKKIILILTLLALIPMAVLAWDDCPHSEINCPYPGDCNRYIDTDNDKICDHSQPAPEDRNDSVAIIAVESNSGAMILEAAAEINSQPERIYHLLPIFLFLTVLYAISHILSKKKIISVVFHRKIWNILLLVSFLISGILGILLILEINFGAKFFLPINMLFWHVEIGIAMFVISIFHIFWHWAYFKNMFMLNKH